MVKTVQIKLEVNRVYKIKKVRGKFKDCEFTVTYEFDKRLGRHVFIMPREHFIASLDSKNYNVLAIDLKLPDSKNVFFEVGSVVVIEKL